MLVCAPATPGLCGAVRLGLLDCGVGDGYF